MSFIIEVYYHAPSNLDKEKVIKREIEGCRGSVVYREESDQESEAICLTGEFTDIDSAEAAAVALRAMGEHVEGPQDYGGAIENSMDPDNH